MSSCRLLFHNGVVLPSGDVPPVSTFLQSHSGAYTTTRTINNGKSLLLWERHLSRLSGSIRILLNSKPEFLFGPGHLPFPIIQPVPELSISSLVNGSMSNALKFVQHERGRNDGEEIAVTVLVSGDMEKLNRINGENGDLERRVMEFLDVWLHIGSYCPSPFGVRENAANLALAGRGRDAASAKYSDWVRLRKPLEKLRPVSATELLLSNNGDHLLEGCITNFFVVCHKKQPGKISGGSFCQFEVQTAPISDGVLPGVIRELVIEVCLSIGIPLREISPSWSEHELWEEAFITSSLRVVQHVEIIKVPITSWESFPSEKPEEVEWKEKRFRDGPGMITELIQKEIMRRGNREGYPLSYF
ncbi:PREDICTED: uncharacterized protein LOC104809986 [Tarenaya hassleriana]|uniref:uncharacterized protein LOC104809986 n=1 Tax=Tarenaya hassleriana TaxID=28532 RepID=UPI00053C9D89|nr:PREDICTED: uncharacterized protein LOC104809986 [Tarenaya hassleriana]